ncbi:sigma 54-interacting transcriptional regulator, partial [Pseudomonas aeruginosa]|nr:sigma 54-interacting transcriptional regulator [Pseudomonas aeruginosa]
DFRRALKVYARDVPLLLNGETGSGKEAFAKAVHLAGPRAEQAFVALNCAAIPETLIESELFGYRGGSFTGARKEGMRGKLQQADGGTLFLDEIGDMPLALQTRLLRVLEERRVVPLGGEPEDVDVRLISATHRDLAELVADGRFREDLYYRLNGMVVSLPPLRERSDREELLDYLLAEEARGQRIQLDGEVRQGLLAYRWPGNVRQLENVIRRSLLLHGEGGALLDEVAFADDGAEAVGGEAALSMNSAAVGGLREALAQQERNLIEDALRQARGNLSRAAARLRIPRTTLLGRMRRLGLPASLDPPA